MGYFFWGGGGGKIPNILLGCLKILIFLDAGSELAYAEKNRVPPPPTPPGQKRQFWATLGSVKNEHQYSTHGQ